MALKIVLTLAVGSTTPAADNGNILLDVTAAEFATKFCATKLFIRSANTVSSGGKSLSIVVKTLEVQDHKKNSPLELLIVNPY